MTPFHLRLPCILTHPTSPRFSIPFRASWEVSLSSPFSPLSWAFHSLDHAAEKPLCSLIISWFSPLIVCPPDLFQCTKWNLRQDRVSRPSTHLPSLHPQSVLEFISYLLRKTNLRFCLVTHITHKCQNRVFPFIFICKRGPL